MDGGLSRLNCCNENVIVLYFSMKVYQMTTLEKRIKAGDAMIKVLEAWGRSSLWYSGRFNQFNDGCLVKS